VLLMGWNSAINLYLPATNLGATLMATYKVEEENRCQFKRTGVSSFFRVGDIGRRGMQWGGEPIA
jgi:hypothetical protein